MMLTRAFLPAICMVVTPSLRSERKAGHAPHLSVKPARSTNLARFGSRAHDGKVDKAAKAPY